VGKGVIAGGDRKKLIGNEERMEEKNRQKDDTPQMHNSTLHRG
jgi:hypothetical protein